MVLVDKAIVAVPVFAITVACNVHKVRGRAIVRFDMGQATLSQLRQQTSGSNEDLGDLVRKLIAAAEPLEGKFNGGGKSAFDAFKSRADQVSADLNSALAAILSGQSGMDSAFGQGDQEQAESTRQTQATANFDAARFGSRPMNGAGS
jgi:uncharacterized protein YukE